MTTRDIGNGPRQYTHSTETVYIAGQVYYQITACDGWPSGPCPDQAKAIERVTAYERCEEVSEAAPQQASRAQMGAFLVWGDSLSYNTHTQSYSYAPTSDIGGRPSTAVRSIVTKLATAAIRDGLHSQSWVIASAEFVRLIGTHELPQHVINAGGTMVRRRLPNTAIPSRGT